MSRQLNLFEKRFTLFSYENNPKNNYEHFVNKKWDESTEQFGRKQDFPQFVLGEWEKIKRRQRKSLTIP